MGIIILLYLTGVVVRLPWLTFVKHFEILG